MCSIYYHLSQSACLLIFFSSMNMSSVLMYMVIKNESICNSTIFKVLSTYSICLLNMIRVYLKTIVMCVASNLLQYVRSIC